MHGSPVPVEETYAATGELEADISDLTPNELADYHLAATALQYDGTSVFLSPIVRKNAEHTIEKTHHDLLVASGDAITEELIGDERTRIGGFISGNAEVQALAADPHLRERYLPFADPKEDIAHRSVVHQLGPEATALVSGMRNALRDARDDPEQTLRIAADIGHTGTILFDAFRRDKNEREARWGVNIPMDAPGWNMFSRYLEQATKEIASGDIQAAIVYCNQAVLGAVHDNHGSILERFTRDWQKAEAYFHVLEATRGSYEELARFASYTGQSLVPYLTGKKKSLAGLPNGKPVPRIFTSHLG